VIKNDGPEGHYIESYGMSKTTLRSLIDTQMPLSDRILDDSLLSHLS
jgi:hypothetical protein